MALTQQAVDVILYMEQIYYEDGVLPTNEKLEEITGVKVNVLKNYWKDADFRNAIAARGIIVEIQDTNQSLTMPQLLLANMLMNPSDKRSMREKVKEPSLAAFGVTVQQVNGWLRSPSFQEHHRKRARSLFGNAEPAAYKNFVSAIEAGDQKSIALYFEMTGIYNPKLQVDVNISSVLLRVVEIVSKHVKDPLTLQAIATDLDGLDIGVSAAPGAEMPEIMKSVAIPANSSSNLINI